MSLRFCSVILSGCLLFGASTAFAAADPATIEDVEPSAELQARYQELHTLLSSSAAGKIAVASGEIAPKLVDASPKTAPKAATTWVKGTWGKGAGLADGDIMALAFLVLMEASKSAQEDLKAIMAQVKAINNAKEQLRERSEVIAIELVRRDLKPPKAKRKGKRSPPSPSPILAIDLYPPPEVPELPALDTLSQAELLALAADITARIAEAADLGEKQQLKLQMAMDRMSRAMTHVAELAKKSASANASLLSKLE